MHFLKGCLDLNPATRWTAEQAAAHPFITGENFSDKWAPPPAVKPQQPVSRLIPIPWGIQMPPNNPNNDSHATSLPSNHNFGSNRQGYLFHDWEHSQKFTPDSGIIGANYGAPHYPQNAYQSTHNFMPSSPIHQFSLYHRAPPTNNRPTKTHNLGGIPFKNSVPTNPSGRRHSFTSHKHFHGAPPPEQKSKKQQRQESPKMEKVENREANKNNNPSEDDMLFQMDELSPNLKPHNSAHQSKLKNITHGIANTQISPQQSSHLSPHQSSHHTHKHKKANRNRSESDPHKTKAEPEPSSKKKHYHKGPKGIFF